VGVRASTLTAWSSCILSDVRLFTSYFGRRDCTSPDANRRAQTALRCISVHLSQQWQFLAGLYTDIQTAPASISSRLAHHVTDLLWEFQWLLAPQRLTRANRCLHGAAPWCTNDVTRSATSLPRRRWLRSSTSAALELPATRS
jgi:hypothetical protein